MFQVASLNYWIQTLQGEEREQALHDRDTRLNRLHLTWHCQGRLTIMDTSPECPPPFGQVTLRNAVDASHVYSSAFPVSADTHVILMPEQCRYTLKTILSHPALIKRHYHLSERSNEEEVIWAFIPHVGLLLKCGDHLEIISTTSCIRSLKNH